MNTRPQSSQVDWALDELFRLADSIGLSDPRLGQIDSMMLASETRPDLCAVVHHAPVAELNAAFARREQQMADTSETTTPNFHARCSR